MRTIARRVNTTASPWRNLAHAVARLFLVALLLGLIQCSKSTERQIPVTRLSSDFEPLRAQFNRDAGKVRLLLLLDPI